MPSATPTSSSATASMSMPSGSRSSPHLAGVCGASTTKRARATKAEVAARRAALHDLAEEMQPISVRGALLQATVRGLVEKTELGYRQIQRDVAVMRKASDLPTTGWPTPTVGNASRSSTMPWRRGRTRLVCPAGPYGRMPMPPSKFWLTPSRWRRLPDHLHVLPLMVARGCARLSFLHSAAEAIGDLDVPASSQCR